MGTFRPRISRCSVKLKGAKLFSPFKHALVVALLQAESDGVELGELADHELGVGAVQPVVGVVLARRVGEALFRFGMEQLHLKVLSINSLCRRSGEAWEYIRAGCPLKDWDSLYFRIVVSC